MFWRICPEELSCDRIAASADEYAELLRDEEFDVDWRMEALVDTAAEKLGPLAEGRCYCLKLPAVLGGAYDAANLGTNSLFELISFSGDMAEQIKDVPDGEAVTIKIEAERTE